MKRPNILFFFTDDQRFDTIHALGNPQIRTPTLDRLVERGTAFTHAHIMGGTSGAVCMPSRAMLMTGRGLFGLLGEGQQIDEAHTLLGETLQAAGYRTFGTGKWHNGKRSFARSFTGGDEIFFGGMDDHWNVPVHHFDPAGRYDASFPRCIDAFRTKETVPVSGDHLRPGTHSSELFAEATCRFLEEDDGEAPFFAYVSFMAPHDPRIMPEKYRAMYDPETLDLPPNVLGAHPFDNGMVKGRDEELEDWPRLPERIREHLADYYAMITHVDAQIGRVLDTLERTGRAEDTIIVFAGDNGLALGQHGLMGKQNLYEHSVRVPLLFAGPGISAGERRAQPCYLLDIFPTLCELCGLETPGTVQGQSLAPILRDAAAPAREALYLAFLSCQRAVREGDWKYIEYHVGGRRRRQLFDLANDPCETRNLAEEPAQAERAARLAARLRELRLAHDDTRHEGQTFFGEG